MPRKIRFWRTVGDSYGFIFSDWGLLFRHAGAWVVLGTVIAVVAMASFGPEVLNRPRSPALLLSAGRLVTMSVFVVFQSVSYVAFSVAWHRVVLLGEVHSSFLDAVRFKRRELRFFLYLLGLGLLTCAVFFGATLIGLAYAVGIKAIAGQSPTHFFTSALYKLAVPAAILIGILVVLPYVTRFSLGLPAIAVEEPSGVFGRSWERGWRNGWRLVWGPLFCSIPLGIVASLFGLGQSFFVQIGDHDEPWRTVGFIGTGTFYALGSFAHFIALAGAISFLSLSYRQLVAGDGEL